MPFALLNVIQAHAAYIRRVPEQNWNQIVMKVRNGGPQQLLVQWPLLEPRLFDNSQTALAQLMNVFVPSMEWAEVPYVQLHAMSDFMVGNAAQHCAAAKLAVLQDFDAAYEAFRQMAAPHLTPAALSHYLHAIALNAVVKESPLPYGQKVIRALWKCQAAKEDIAALAIREQWRQHLIKCKISDSDGNVSDIWDLAAYHEYQALLKTWANVLKCKPAQIQIWLANNADSLDVMPECDIEMHTDIMGMLEI